MPGGGTLASYGVRIDFAALQTNRLWASYNDAREFVLFERNEADGSERAVVKINADVTAKLLATAQARWSRDANSSSLLNLTSAHATTAATANRNSSNNNSSSSNSTTITTLMSGDAVNTAIESDDGLKRKKIANTG